MSQQQYSGSSKEITREDILHLAQLSRLSVDETKLDSFEKEFKDILGYVSTITQVDTTGVSDVVLPLSKNVLRQDVYDETRKGAYTDALLKAAPRQEDGYISVSQVFE